MNARYIFARFPFSLCTGFVMLMVGSRVEGCMFALQFCSQLSSAPRGNKSINNECYYSCNTWISRVIINFLTSNYFVVTLKLFYFAF